MKKILKLFNCFILFFLLFWLFLPSSALADNSYTIIDESTAPPTIHRIDYDGLIPCGRCCTTTPEQHASVEGECGISVGVPPAPVSVGTLINRKWIPCTLCHFFVMFDGIIKLILLTIVPAVAILIFTIGGLTLYLAGQNPQKTALAKKILTSAIIGLALVYGSWLIINTILTKLGVAEWTGLENWFQITCEIKIF